MDRNCDIQFWTNGLFRKDATLTLSKQINLMPKTREKNIKNLCEALLNNSTIQTLILSENGLDNNCADEIAILLRTNTCLRSLHVSRNCLTRDGMSRIFHALSKNTTLKKINVGNQLHYQDQVGEGIKGIGCMSYIEELAMDGLDIGEIEAIQIGDLLRKKALLRNLNISFNNLNDKAIYHISEGFKANSILMEMNLAYNTFGEMGMRSLCEALKANTTLESLDISGNDVNDRALMHLCGSMCKLKNLNLSDLNLKDKKEGIGALCDMLRKNSTLETLCLGGNGLDDQAIKLLSESLQENRGLRHLGLDNNKISSEGAAEICDMMRINKHITEISLQSNQVTEDLLEEIKYLAKGNLPWTIGSHISFCRYFQACTLEFLLCMKAIQRGKIRMFVPKVLLLEIIKKVDRKCFASFEFKRQKQAPGKRKEESKENGDTPPYKKTKD